MGRVIRLRDLVYGVEGLALLRHLFEDDPEATDQRLEEIRRVAADPDASPWSLGIEYPERSVDDGYAEWHTIYDEMPNGLIDLEQPAVEAVLAGIEPGRALDAACGTGRLASVLAEHGHEVVGIDGSEPMLRVARDKVPAATFETGDLAALGFGDGEFDVVTCGLAIAHASDIRTPIAELARVTRYGGTMVLTDIHPFAVVLAGQAGYGTREGTFGFVRNYYHPIGEYLAIFSDLGLNVVECIEPSQTEATLANLPSYGFVPEATSAAFRGLPLALVWHLERQG